MTAVVSLARRRHRLRGPHPALADALDRRLVALSARLAARSISLADATTELHDIHVRRTTQAAQRAAVGMPEAVATAFVVAAAAAAVLEVEVDAHHSAIEIARAERRLGEVIVMPCGRTEGAKPAPAREFLHPRDLW